MRERQRLACMPVAAEPTQSEATLCMLARRSRAKACRSDETSQRRSASAGGPARAEREKERERSERDQRARNEPPTARRSDARSPGKCGVRHGAERDADAQPRRGRERGARGRRAPARGRSGSDSDRGAERAEAQPDGGGGEARRSDRRARKRRSLLQCASIPQKSPEHSEARARDNCPQGGGQSPPMAGRAMRSMEAKAALSPGEWSGLRHSTPPGCSLFIVHRKRQWTPKCPHSADTSNECSSEVGTRKGRLTCVKRPAILAIGARIAVPTPRFVRGSARVPQQLHDIIG